MKEAYFITFRSITYAQRGQAALQRAGIESRLQRTPKALSSRGCGYCLMLRGKDVYLGVEILQQQEIDYGKVYAKTASTMEERQL